MQTINKTFIISYEGWDLTAKTLSKLNINTPLSFKRVEDELDTYEIVVSYDNFEIDMLSYKDSLSLVPYIDMDFASINSMLVENVELIKGKTNAQNITQIKINATISYNEEFLDLYNSANGEVLLSASNLPLSMATIALNDYEEDIINQPFLNQYTFSIDMDDDSKDLFEEFDFSKNTDYFYHCELLLNEDFTKCKIKSYIKDENENLIELSLSDFEKETFLELVNHYRIFREEDAISPMVEN